MYFVFKTRETERNMIFGALKSFGIQLKTAVPRSYFTNIDYFLSNFFIVCESDIVANRRARTWGQKTQEKREVELKP